jgi:hypothetical protein
LAPSKQNKQIDAFNDNPRFSGKTSLSFFIYPNTHPHTSVLRIVVAVVVVVRKNFFNKKVL